ncbi:glycosyltransferase family 2 protein [Synechococcus sp. CS-1325]|uniref:glycosyltransferase family 2 protein n=1 Tax=unclassified Synechococcus TaxID=2626047 RepID=UPI000DB637BF|nr:MULTISPECIES: glycosyltransferase family 2 protein [unclassified Synechococcus]PZU97543.1 MAG: family 2 glycosyl transferase [Cyanobium sp.]MCT0200865.1 glycosyltransferase family 2 protein [Synechococcus sp. CS-1325]MCT0213903.1 glycosyltransferase family 2 protein [Synechococcus sp. CS-1326]MCT0230805.1 glycosyltransferase family 2 protein [Synechococcus sp. CS-1324]MCT0233479.1 glycosyltransferase family 2 protein [Synechococcus sp. CS-1327]
MFPSVVIPTYNRRAILEKCLRALERQQLAAPIDTYEVVVVDDGSTDGTADWLRRNAAAFPHVRLIEQDHGGPAAGRNRGVEQARGDVIVFIDSDLVVTELFLLSHARALSRHWLERGNKLCFTYGAVINTSNFDDPTSEPHKLSDHSWAYFATGNVAIDRSLLELSGLFDTGFRLYGWEDLELGERLRRMGVELVRCPEAPGYHWHPALSLEQVPDLVRIEQERARMGLVFYRKHPTRRVRFIIQFTWLHRLLWELLTLGGLLNERSLRPLLAWLLRHGHSALAMELLRLPLNRIGVRALYREARAEGLS